MITCFKKYIYITYLLLVKKINRAYYASDNSKSHLRIRLDLLKWFCREFEFNYYYFAMGLNFQRRSINSFIGKREFFEIQQFVELKLKENDNCLKLDYNTIIKDKFYSAAILLANNIPCVKNLAIISNSKIIHNSGRITTIKEGLKDFNYPIIIKNTILEYNEGFNKCEVINNNYIVNNDIIDLEKFISKLSKGKWVIQDVQQNCEEIKVVNDSALNTTRIVTILNGEKPVFLTGFQAFATNNEITDSWGKGAIYVGIDPVNSCLKANGRFHPSRGKQDIVYKHPDSGFFFKDYKINGLKEAIEICLKAHAIFYYNFVIGWDVAITDNGPQILEANERPGMNAVQCVDKGLRLEIKHYSKNLGIMNGG